MTRFVLVALTFYLFSTPALQTYAQTSSLEGRDSQSIDYEILKKKIISLRELLSQFDCDVQYPLINGHTYLKNASDALEDSLKAHVTIAPLYMSVAEKSYNQAVGYYKIAVKICTSK